MRQISRGPPQHLRVLLQQSVASPQLTHFAPFVASVTGLTFFLNIGLFEPVDQRLVRDPEILHDRDNVTPGSASDPVDEVAAYDLADLLGCCYGYDIDLLAGRRWLFRVRTSSSTPMPEAVGYFRRTLASGIG